MKRMFALLLALCMIFLRACTPIPATLQPSQPAQPPPTSQASQPLDDVAQLQSDVRYVFEQIWLPQMVLEFDSETIVAYIRDANVEAMRESLISSLEFVAMRMMMETFSEELIEDPLWGFIELWEEQRWAEQIVNVTIERLDEETSAFIIKMLDIERFLRSTYIAIVYNEADGLQIFTLEQSHEFHVLCFVNAGSRGSFFSVENDREAFIEAIISVL